eukprot:460745_1
MSQPKVFINIYNPNLLVSKDDLDPDDVCGICHNVCNVATSIGCRNGDIFCENCINILCDNNVNKSKQSIKCPSCDERVYKNKIAANQYAIKSISKYRIRCLYSNYDRLQHENKDDEYDEGTIVVTNNDKINYCLWTGVISDVLDHINNKCEFAVQQCEFCNFSVCRKNMKKHLLDCPMSPVQCLLKCGKTIRRSKMNEHVEKYCLESFVNCNNRNCDQQIQRKNIHFHQSEKCNFRMVDCDYLRYGCLNKICKNDLETHLNENKTYHLELKIKFMEKTLKSLQKK